MEIPLTQMIRWLFLALLIGVAGHYYLYRKLAVSTGWAHRSPRSSRAVFLVLGVVQVATFVLSGALSPESYRWFFYFSYTYLGFFSTLMVVLLLADLVYLAVALVHRVRTAVHRASTAASTQPKNPERRELFRKAAAGGALLTGVATTASGVATVLGGFEVKSVSIPLAKLPEAFEGYRIVQISDIHIGPTIQRDFVRNMVDTVNALRPDLVAITGDLVDGSPENLGHHAAPLADLSPNDGSYFVTGNHEYYSGVEGWIAEVERLGISPLRNRRTLINRAGSELILAGVNDYHAERYGESSDLGQVLEGRDPNLEVILLAHQPAHVHQAQKHDVGLQISGHTHGGQFWPWNMVVYLAQPVVRGLARFGRTLIYVSTGTGYWGPPMRNGSKPEITVLTLKRAQAAIA